MTGKIKGQLSDDGVGPGIDASPNGAEMALWAKQQRPNAKPMEAKSHTQNVAIMKGTTGSNALIIATIGSTALFR